MMAPFTVLAPTDEAFAAALEALDGTAEELLARDDLADILKEPTLQQQNFFDFHFPQLRNFHFPFSFLIQSIKMASTSENPSMDVEESTAMTSKQVRKLNFQYVILSSSQTFLPVLQKYFCSFRSWLRLVLSAVLQHHCTRSSS